MSHYNVQVPGERNWKENRENNIKGELSQPGDIDEAWRSVCALNSAKITDIRALIKNKENPMTLDGLVATCKHFGLILIIDGSMDFFCVKHQDKGEMTVEAPKAAQPEGPESNDDESPERGESDTPKERFNEIGSEEPVSDEMKIDDDDEEDLF
jgi:hypothetical protein